LGILVLHKRVKGIVMEEICYMGPKRIVAHVAHAHMTTSRIHLYRRGPVCGGGEARLAKEEEGRFGGGGGGITVDLAFNISNKIPKNKKLRMKKMNFRLKF
jgi:hypothetical protein